MKMGQSFYQLVVPKGLQRQVMSVNHESAFRGHLGAKKTEVLDTPELLARTSSGFAVPAMYTRAP